MLSQLSAPALETKYTTLGTEIALKEGVIEGYASLFGATDQGGDTVMPGAYKASLAATTRPRGAVKMLWQHDPLKPIGVWDDIHEDGRGLYVKGRILKDVQAGREALSLLEAGAIDGLSIGYRTRRADKSETGGRRLLEVDLWEVSVVTFPMLPEARVQATADAEALDLAGELAEVFAEARALMA
ncbi:HK97 family phage prohead protease [Algicella marina]|uniref:HK97 family phage prohead protease n=1 Tax=Algicella marina TaxID=2683284 RepID=A0A6P1SYJ2_9RHOB|nr:HK97 family phage prohead protease [Algicella marina]QHQ34551.1 HK97 family phage prohead protease [Algicella marina]